MEPAVLAVLTAGPIHGYDLRAALDDVTCGLLVADPGGLYRLLRRMEDDGLVTSAWTEGEHGPQRRTYELTADGCEALASWRPRLLARRHAIDNLLAVTGSADDAHA
jgi:DNA-binding PadR family transcriptional regulator